MSMKHVYIYTDGACQGNPGKGGWGALLKYGDAIRELAGAEPETTNNRMELTAVIKALAALKEPCEVTLTTDSRYVVDGIAKGWAKSWQDNGWVNSRRRAVANVDLWSVLLSMLNVHHVTFSWVRGHSGHPENERCDQLAVNAYLSI